MTPTPPSATSSNSGHSPDAQFRVVRKRNRIPLSCGPCRHRKLKCNRQHPCDNCTKRGEIDTCTYASPSLRKKSTSSAGPKGSPDEMQTRIDRLEGLVLSLMTNGSQAAGPTAANAAIAATGGKMGRASVSSNSTGFGLNVDGDDIIPEEPEDVGQGEESEVEQVTKSVGIMKVDNNKTFFIPENHWYAVLAEISEVKNYFSEHKKQIDEQMTRTTKGDSSDEAKIGSSYLLTVDKPKDKADILREFPSKAICDTLITRFFQNYNLDATYQIMHGPTYQKQYDAHWTNPEETPVTWLGLSFAMMSIAVQSYMRAGDEPSDLSGQMAQMLRDYRRLTAQCILFNDLSWPHVGTVELLLLFMSSESARSPDSQAGILMLISMIVRVAMRSGYHRDAKDYAVITPFQGEMRRRAWVIVRSADLLFSTQFGLPPMVRPMDCNTGLPSNLYEDELSDDMKELPPSRAMTETTPVTYCIYKGKLMSLFGEVVEEVQTLAVPSYERVMALDQKLRELHADIPPAFKMRPLEESCRDAPPLVIQRYVIDLAYQRVTIVLHRKFICQSRETSRFLYSRRTVLEAAMQILQHQATLFFETRPHGRLSSVRFSISSLTAQDFLLAAMVITLDLHSQAEAEANGHRASLDFDDYSPDRRSTQLAAIEKSLEIWSSLRDSSLEAVKAHSVLTAMLGGIRTNQAKVRQQVNQSPSGFGHGTRYPPPPNPSDDVKLAPEHSAAMTLGMLSTGALTPNSANLFAGMDGVSSTLPQAMPSAGVSSSGTGSDSTGLTPGYFGVSMDAINASAPVSSVFPATPFSNFFGGSALGFGFSGFDVPNNGIDWDALDSYMSNPAADPAANRAGWNNLNMDSSLMDVGAQSNVEMDALTASTNGINPALQNGAPAQNQQQQQQQHQQQGMGVNHTGNNNSSNGNLYNANMFMNSGLRG